MFALTRHIFLYILIFVNFPQIPYFAVYHVWAMSSSRGVLMNKILFRIKKYEVRAFQRHVERTCSPLQC